MPTLCQYQDINGNCGAIARHVRCVHCGHLAGPIASDFPLETFQAGVARVCPHPSERMVQPMPSMAQRLLSYAAAYWREHKPSSLPLIFERFSRCSPCEHYNDLLGACSVCGCYVNLLAYNEGVNKLADENESCPLPSGQKRWEKIG